MLERDETDHENRLCPTFIGCVAAHFRGVYDKRALNTFNECETTTR